MATRGTDISQAHVLGIACLGLSAKYYELDKNIPYMEDYMHFSTDPIRKTELLNAERQILAAFDWKLEVFTPLYLINLLFYIGLKSSGNSISEDKLNSYKTYQCAITLCEMCLKEPLTLEWKPSKIAASCILASRRINGVIPLWSKNLVDLTKYSEAEATEVGKMLCSITLKKSLIKVSSGRSTHRGSTNEKENRAKECTSLISSNGVRHTLGKQILIVPPLQEKSKNTSVGDCYFPLIKPIIGVSKENGKNLFKSKISCKSTINAFNESRDSGIHKHSSQSNGRNFHSSLNTLVKR